MRLKIISVLLVLTLIALPGGASPQAAASRLQGTVQDPSGAVIPGAHVTAISNRTQIHSDVTTNGEGFFLFPSLQPDTYALSVTAPGFRATTVANIELIVGANESEFVKLDIGPVTDSVSVDASEVHVQTTQAAMSGEVNMHDIDTLPQLLRTPALLADFQAGVVQVPGGAFAVVNGTRQGANNVTLDGIDFNFVTQPFLGYLGFGVGTNTDSVEEFRIVTNGAKAEYGRNGGSQIQVITRSGTNVYHGNLFEYLRNADLNANDFFNNSSGVARPQLVMNTFGGSVGGYVDIPRVYNGKDQTFFFFNYQGQRVAQQIVVNRTVPTDTARRGIFQWRVPGTGELRSFDIVANDPRGIGIDKQVAATLPLMPLPNNIDIGDGLNLGGFRFNQPAPTVEDQWTAKLDHNFGPSQRIYYRFSHKTFSNSFSETYPGQPFSVNYRHNLGFSAGWNSIWKPWLVNEFLTGYQANNQDLLYGRPKTAVVFPNSWSDPIVTAGDDIRHGPVIQIGDNLSLQWRKHSFKTGLSGIFTNQHTANELGVFPLIQLARANGAVPPGTAGPNGAIISGADRTRFENLYNDLLGRVSRIGATFLTDTERFLPAGSQRVRNYLRHDYSYFFQDDWRIRKNLTFNLGLRWEFFGRPVERDGIQGVLKQAALINTASQISDVTVQRGTNWYANDWNNFASRFGFAWDAFGNGKMAIRAGYGIFYDRVIGQGASFDVDPGTPGFSQTAASFPNQAAGSDMRLSDNPQLPAPPAAPLLTPADDRTSTLSLFDPHFRTPYVQQFNFSIQWQAFRNTVVEAAYVGTRGVKLNTESDVDSRTSPDFLQAFKEIQAFRTNNTPVSAGNTLVRIFGSASAAVSALGASIFDQGQVGQAAQTLDVNNYSRYAAAGVSDFYIRNHPQFNTAVVSSNFGRSYYNSMQLSIRRRKGALGLTANYTLSKSIDNASEDANLFSAIPIDASNMTHNRGFSDFDRTHVFTWTASYTLPIGRGQLVGRGIPKWLDPITAGWDVGSVGTWMSGQAMTALSGYQTAGLLVPTWANYNGSDRNIGAIQKQGSGVFFWTPDQIAKFSLPGAGEIGTAGRNTFHGPGFFDLDLAVSKRFRFNDRHSVVFRTEAYNLPNHTNFAPPNLTLSSPSFGRISTALPVSPLAGSGRTLQAALRYEF